jgi:predicted metal-dependent enzyme (double-stranded beta helix superfamily)
MSQFSRRSLLAGTAGALVAQACAAPARKKTATMTKPFERDRFVEEVRQARPQGQEAVAEVIARAVSDPASVLRELGEPTQATITALYRSPELSIFNIVWPPFVVLVPHDHLMWASIGVYAGRENNIVWEPRGQTIEATDASSVAGKEVFSLPPDAIHSVTNPVERYTCALHVYGGDLGGTTRSQWDALTLTREPFDMEDARRILGQADQRFARR